jgi:hypothetical protein
MTDTTQPDTEPSHCGIQLEYASGSWWAACDCGWDNGQPMATEMAATDEWVAHQDTRL